jgi:hypothetical protein
MEGVCEDVRSVEEAEADLGESNAPITFLTPSAQRRYSPQTISFCHINISVN